jgi:hypothetical protein
MPGALELLDPILEAVRNAAPQHGSDALVELAALMPVARQQPWPLPERICRR